MNLAFVEAGSWTCRSFSWFHAYTSHLFLYAVYFIHYRVLIIIVLNSLHDNPIISVMSVSVAWSLSLQIVCCAFGMPCKFFLIAWHVVSCLKKKQNCYSQFFSMWWWGAGGRQAFFSVVNRSQSFSEFMPLVCKSPNCFSVPSSTMWNRMARVGKSSVLPFS